MFCWKRDHSFSLTGWLKYSSQKQEESQVKTQVCVPGVAMYSPVVLNKGLTLSTLFRLVLNMEVTVVPQRTAGRLPELNCLVLSKHSDVLIAGHLYLYLYYSYIYIYTHTDLYIGTSFQILPTCMEYVQVCQMCSKQKATETSYPPFPRFPGRKRSCGPSWLNAKPELWGQSG